jgi:hypothetical protein
MPIVRELLTKIGFEIEGEEPLEKVEGLLEGIHHRLELLAGAELVRKLYEVSEQFANWGAQVLRTSENLGITSDEFQKLQFAAQKSGISSEEMSHSLQILARRLYEAKTGSVEASQAFRLAGFSSDQVNGFKNSEQALLAFSDILAKTEDPIKRAALAQQLLGRGGAQFVAFLVQGRKRIHDTGEEMKKFGLVLSGPQLLALEETEQGFQKLTATMHVFGAQIASAIGPVFVRAIDLFLEFYAANKSIIDANIHEWLLNVAAGMGYVVGGTILAARWLLYLAKLLHIDKDILPFIGMVAGAASGLLALGTAFKIASGIFSAAAPFIEFAVALGAIVVAAHDVYAALNGLETWTGRALDAFKNLEPVKEFFKGIKDAAGGLDNLKFADKLGDKLDSFKTKLEKWSTSSNILGDIANNDDVYAFTNKIVKALDTALIASGFAISLGVSMAKAFVTGLADYLVDNNSPGILKGIGSTIKFLTTHFDSSGSQPGASLGASTLPSVGDLFGSLKDAVIGGSNAVNAGHQTLFGPQITVNATGVTSSADDIAKIAVDQMRDFFDLKNREIQRSFVAGG